ncbi:hypothetical protein Ciccas_012045 [Cichlidogyrus casuarinus]|uniref:Uncharacterized protein n=1 Tax=Cichlidogyrus casuarinus TaxID=1844966 RepID=A0ABD2PQ04_9PLAT
MPSDNDRQSKAFDMIDLEVVASPEITKFLKYYLHNNHSSEDANVCSDVPQGNCLGPLFVQSNYLAVSKSSNT